MPTIEAMAAASDFSRVARRPSERLAVVEHIITTPNLQENEHLEWKSGYDLSTKPGAAKTAKQLIGMANREPARAARLLEGHAYVILGVDAGRLHGLMKRWDSADIENWIAPFVGPDLVYDIHYVEVRGRDVLMFVVGPSKQGDPIFALQRTTQDEHGKEMRAGTIYVRRGGKTEVADPAEIAMLTNRARAAGSRLALDVQADVSTALPIGAQLLTDTTRDAYLDLRRRKLLSELPQETGILALVGPGGEFRKPEVFQRQVEFFVQAATKNWVSFALVDHVEKKKPALRLSIVNSTEENFEDVVLEVTVPLSRSFVHRSPTDAREKLKPPKEPARWGSDLASLIRPPLEVDPLSQTAIDELDEHTTKVRFAPRLVRPHTTHPMEPLTLALLPEHEGAELTLDWRATARNTRGQITGVVRVEIARLNQQGLQNEQAEG
jgi:hypothetical protein